MRDDGPIDNRATAPGALLVLAGLGGPDAVRQLLSALPPTLRVPVLLYQHLDTGKHDRLLGQLAKASRLPLDLAHRRQDRLRRPRRRAAAGRGRALRRGWLRLRRRQRAGRSGRGAAAAESVVLLLSGADPSVVPAVLALQDAGALVLAQDPESCFDSTAAGLLIDAGAVAASPAELARIVIERWK